MLQRQDVWAVFEDDYRNTIFPARRKFGVFRCYGVNNGQLYAL
jgi:hypothetical protein